MNPLDLKSPKSEPAKSFEKSNTEKEEKTKIASKPNQKPDTKPKNKIEPRKIDSNKEPKHNLQPRKINTKAPSRHKLEPRKIDPNKEPKHNLQPRKINPKTPSRHKIKPRKIDQMKEPIRKIQHQRFTPEKSINKNKPKNLELSPKPKMKIEQIPTNEPKNTAEPEVKQFSPEQIKQEIKNIDWKSVSENWTVKVSANKEITLNPYALPSKENPLYKHKQWLQTVYNHKKWNLNDDRLRMISGVSHTTIYKWRKKLDIPTKQNLYGDGKQKECGRCLQIKPIDKYGARMTRGKKILFTRCKKCRIDINQIYKYNNKVKIIQNVYNGKLKGKCQMCSADIKKLPSLEFHHLDPKLKSEKGISLSQNWEKTKNQVEKEKATILCGNCHTKQRSKYYNNHIKIIQENNLNPLASNNQISQYVKNKLPNADYEVCRQVSRSIRKQIVINHLYEGKCVGCGDINTKNNLPALQFHHRDKNNPYKMSKTYVNLRDLEIKEILKKLKKDNCISLCGDCHRMEQSTQFKNNYEKIVRPEYWDDIKKYYEILENNIKNFKFKKDQEQEPVIKPRISLNKEKNGTKLPKEESMNFINNTPQKDVGEYLKIINNKNPINLKVDINGDLKLEPKSNQKEIIRSMIVPKESNNNVKNLVHQKGLNENIKSEKDPNNINLDNNSSRPKPLKINELEKLQNAEYGYGEAWMKYLVHIAKLTQEKTIIRTKDIADSVGVITRNVRKNLVKLANKELIITSSEHNDRHVLLSEKGLEELNKIKDLKSKKK